MKGLSYLTEKEEIITLVDEEGEQFDFVVLDYFQVDDLNYAILFPLENNAPQGEQEDTEEEAGEREDHDAEEAVIFRVVEGDNGETLLHVIEDEEEWEKVAGIAYERLLSTDNNEE